MTTAWKNKLVFGDNLPMLRDEQLIPTGSVDLIYLDPPFNSNATYNVLFKEHTGSLSHAQIAAFEDTWKWSLESEAAYNELITTGPPKLADLMEAFRKFLKTSDMMAYIAMMAPRLLELHRVLKPTGSLYLHCDPTASHYIKLVLDAIFGQTSFRNEIVWLRSKNPKGSQFGLTRFSPFTDSIFYYCKTEESPIYLDAIRPALSVEALKKKYPYSDELGPYADGPILRGNGMGPRPNLVYEYKGFTPGPAGWRVERKVLEQIDKDGNLNWTGTGVRRKLRPDKEKGQPIGSFWGDIPPINSQAQERLGYPTQKPEALLERIIKASSKPGDLVLDPFCGCGTTITVAEQLKRRWIGIDITHLAVSLMRYRLKKTMGSQLSEYQVIGAPTDLEGAEALAKYDRYQFQYWALGVLEAQAVYDKKGEKKKGADTGIDGYIKFIDDDSGKAKTIIISVKSGHVQVKDVRELAQVVKRDKAVMGVFLTLEAPTKPMRDEALSEGFYISPFTQKTYPVIQVLTIQDLFDGKTAKYPESGAVTLKAAPLKGHKDEQIQLI